MTVGEKNYLAVVVFLVVAPFCRNHHRKQVWIKYLALVLPQICFLTQHGLGLAVPGLQDHGTDYWATFTTWWKSTWRKSTLAQKEHAISTQKGSRMGGSCATFLYLKQANKQKKKHISLKFPKPCISLEQCFIAMVHNVFKRMRL